METKFVLFMVAMTLSACASTETSVQQAIKKNPKLVFQAIEDNPEEFIEVVNRAAQKAQENMHAKRIEDIKKQEAADLRSPKAPALSKDRRLLGNDSAKIVVVEYGDFQCPACRMGAQSMKEFLKKYEGKVQLYVKHMPLDFHKMAGPAAAYFEAVRMQSPEKSLRFHDLLFSNQQKLVDESFLKKMAASVGANLKDLARDLQSSQLQSILEADRKEFESFGFTGTPVVLINGVTLSGAQPLSELERVAKISGGL